MSRGLRLRLEDILEAITRIERYLDGYTYETFCADQRTVDAVIRNLEIIGEAVRGISQDVLDSYPSMPWSAIRNMRNVLAHAYFGVSLPIVWQTATVDLQPLRVVITDQLAQMP